MNILLWIIQGLLALLFLFSGVMKFVMSVEEMNGPPAPVKLPGLFLHFIGVCEILGGLGLILPMLLHIKPKLTPIAACGLAIIMVGAVAIGLKGGIGLAVVPLRRFAALFVGRLSAARSVTWRP